MSKCDYCCIRRRSILINCVKCCPSRSLNICFKCSINVIEIVEHSKHHPMSTYKLCDIPLNEVDISSWLCRDEINLIEMIETYGLGNWNDIQLKLNINSKELQKHFEQMYFSRFKSPFAIYFERLNSLKHLIGENEISSESIIYPPMLICSEEQKLLTYMPQRDEYEREYLNEGENRLPTLTIDEETNSRGGEDVYRTLIDKAKLILFHSYKQTLIRRLQLKDFIRDYALAFNYQPDKEFDLHQISRFLSADEYERLVFNHRRIQNLLEEVGCSTSSNGNNRDQSQSKKKSPLLNAEKRRRRTPSIVVDESSSSISSCQSNLTFSSPSSNEEFNSRSKRRSIRRVSSSSSTNTSSKIVSIKEPLYTRRRVINEDIHSISQRMTRSTGNLLTTSDWNSSDDDEMTLFEDYHFQDQQSNVASRTRSHTPPLTNNDKKQLRNSPNGKRTSNHLNSYTKSNMFDPSDQSTPKINRMLTRHQLVVQQTSPNKKRKIHSTSNDDELIQI